MLEEGEMVEKVEEVEKGRLRRLRELKWLSVFFHSTPFPLSPAA